VLPTGDEPAVDFLVPGVLAISVAATGLVAVSIQTAFERKYGVLKRLGGTPLPRSGFLVAKGLAVAAVLAVQTALVVGLALGLLGWSPEGGAVVAPLAVLLGAVSFTALGLLLAGTLRAEATLALSNALFLILLVISGVTFDAATLPDALAVVGQALPVGALAEVLRAAFAGEGVHLRGSRSSPGGAPPRSCWRHGRSGGSRRSSGPGAPGWVRRWGNGYPPRPRGPCPSALAPQPTGASEPGRRRPAGGGCTSRAAGAAHESPASLEESHVA
jgi:ABC transporter DrrB family efflux protein